MRQSAQSAGTTTVWVLALGTAVFAARYFFIPQPWPTVALPEGYLRGPSGLAGYGLTLHAFSRHSLLFQAHVLGGLAALAVGLFQFVGWLRDAHPALHRALGRVYLGAIAVSSLGGLPLSFMLLGPVPPSMRVQFYPLAAGFASLAIAWPVITAVAFARVRHRRFEEHRAWMMRSYSLTYAAVTVRVVSVPLLFLTGNVFIAFSAAVLSWPLNLLVAEWLIRRDWPRQAISPQPSVVS